MSKATAYATFLNLLGSMRRENPDPEFEGCEEVIAFVYGRESEGKDVKITDLVQSLRFGTGPTVHRKLSTLNSRGFITSVRSHSDGRAKTLKCTAKGLDILKERSKLLQKCLEA